MQVDVLRDEGQTEPDAAVGGVAFGGGTASEALEDAFAFSGRDAGAGVVDLNAGTAVDRPNSTRIASHGAVIGAASPHPPPDHHADNVVPDTHHTQIDRRLIIRRSTLDGEGSY